MGYIFVFAHTNLWSIGLDSTVEAETEYADNYWIPDYASEDWDDCFLADPPGAYEEDEITNEEIYNETDLVDQPDFFGNLSWNKEVSASGRRGYVEKFNYRFCHILIFWRRFFTGR